MLRGVCLDIDGVLLRGKRVLQGASESVRRLQENGVPHLFMTNGGGRLEQDRANELSELLKVPVRADQVILSHTPMKELKQFWEKRVLILGCREEEKVAREYGFRKIVSPQLFCAQHEHLYPFRSTRLEKGLFGVEDPFKADPVEGILIMHDPVDWHLEVQVCIDILCGRDPIMGVPPGSRLTQRVPIFNSNDDFVFAGSFPHPRFAQGAFLETLNHLFKLTTGGLELDVQKFGKPHKVTYQYAEELLKKQVGRKDDVVFSQIFMVGDNPHADIQGAHNAGQPWTSVLVETGVYHPGSPDTGGADHVVANVSKAIDLVLTNE